MMNHFMIDGRYKDLLTYHGLDVGMVLKKARLPEDLLNHRNPVMKENEYYRFMEAIEQVSNNPEMPIKLSTTDQIESFSPPIFASYCSKNGRVCIERLSRYKKLIGPMVFAVKAGNEYTTVALLPGDQNLELPGFLVQSEVSFLVNILRKATKETIVPVAVTMKCPPASDVLASWIGIVPEKGDTNSITFTNSELEEPFISFDEAMWSYFEPELNKRLSELDVDDSISARVRSALTELLPGGSSGIEDVAEKLGLSKRTLQRKLSEEHTTFQKQLNSTREILAKHYIQNTDMTSNDIAYLLGYAELNSFFRAFTAWTGKSISDFKKSDYAEKSL